MSQKHSYLHRATIALCIGAAVSCSAIAADRWQSLTDESQFDSETFKSSRADGETVVHGWVRFSPTWDSKIKAILFDVDGYCGSRLLTYKSSIMVNTDGTQDASSSGGSLTISPGNRFEDALKAMCARVKPWWKPF